MPVDPGYDYTLDDAEADVIGDFAFGQVTYDKSAEDIEKSRARRDIPPGEHELFVAGFLKAPERATKSTYVDGKSITYAYYKLGVRLSMVGDPAATIIDFFDLPGDTQRDVHAFMHGSKKPDGKNAGFMAEKLGFFVDRIGFRVEKGQPLPLEALSPKNWLGRKFVATIELQKQKDNQGNPKINPSTMEEYEPRAGIKLFSYRTHPDSVSGGKPAVATSSSQQYGRPAQASRPTQPRQQATQQVSASPAGPSVLERVRGAL